MKLDEYESPPTFAEAYAPRPNAAHLAAAKKRQYDPAPIIPVTAARPFLPPGSAAPLGILAALIIVMMLGMSGWQLASGPRALQITPVPTSAPTAAPALAVPTSAPPTAAPTSVPTPPPAPTSAPQTGQGLTLAQDAAAPVDAAAPAATAPSYLANIAIQAPHSPRGGVTGPCDKQCVPAPTAPPEMLVIIRQQAPHEVR